MTLRGIAVGIALIFVNLHLQFRAEPMRMVWVTNVAPFANVIFLLFLVTILNALLARVSPRRALRAPELIAVYGMLSVQTGLSSAHVLHVLMGTITYGTWGATPSNRWASEYLPHMPSWLLVADSEALRGYYLGQSRFLTAANLRAWLTPMLAWTLFFYAMAIVLLSVAILYSRQWARRERLSYPIVELTFQMVATGSAFWRQRLMWAGFGIAAVAELLNGLNYLYPSVPQLPIRRLNIGPMFTEPPWNALGETNISFYPFIIGLSFLIPVDLSVSMWVFYLLSKAQSVFGAVVGWNAIPHYPFTREQQFGAGAAIILAGLWGSWDHLRHVWRLAFGNAGDPSGRLYRRAFLMLFGGSVATIWFMSAAGMAWWMAVVVHVLYLFMGLVVARIRCELGFPLHAMPRMNGPNLLMLADGAQNLGQRHVAVLGLFDPITVYNDPHLLPHQFEGLKLIDRETAAGGDRETRGQGDKGTRGQGALVTGMVVAILVAVPATFLVYLTLTYQYGAGSAYIALGQAGSTLFRSVLPMWSRSDVYRDPNLLSLGVMAGSFGVANVLMVWRWRFLGWPLHPLGLAVANGSSDLGDVVCAVFLASVLKASILRLAGLQGYRKAVPFFLGLILGDMVTGMTWVVGGILFNTPTYRFFL